MSNSDSSPAKPSEESAENATDTTRFNAKEYLERTLVRRPSDLMTIRRIPQSCAYRVNWYDRAVVGETAVAGLSVRYIRKSEFMFCRLGDDGKPGPVVCIVLNGGHHQMQSILAGRTSTGNPRQPDVGAGKPCPLGIAGHGPTLDHRQVQ